MRVSGLLAKDAAAIATRVAAALLVTGCGNGRGEQRGGHDVPLACV